MQKLAIIGTGIAGMGAAYFLRDRFDITFFEKENYVGGHTNTITVKENGQDIPIDTAFMVFNESTYPLLTRLFKELDVKVKPTTMSFSVQHVPSKLEFCGSGYNGLFSQRVNIFNKAYIKMLMEIDRFNKESVEVLDDPKLLHLTLAEYTKLRGYSDDFVEKFLVPMSSAVWSTPADTMLGFPAMTLVQFFKNHCFLGIKGHLQWLTCVDGSRQYRDKLLAKVNAQIYKDRAIAKVAVQGDKAIIKDASGAEMAFDKVIIACHADEALEILENPTDLEKNLLKHFPYHANRTTLHNDASVMPKSKRAWSAWNYRIQEDANGKLVTTTIYDMNILQGVSKGMNYFISINDPGIVDPQKILWEKMYRHPVYSVESQKAQNDLPKLNQQGPIYFSGAYFRYGFHEDGLWSALNAARAIAGEDLWA